MFTNPKNSKIYDPCTLLLNISNKINLKRNIKYVDLSNLSICYTWKNTQTSNKSNKFKISAPLWNEEFEYLENNGEKTNNSSLRIFVN